MSRKTAHPKRKRLPFNSWLKKQKQNPAFASAFKNELAKARKELAMKLKEKGIRTLSDIEKMVDEGRK